MVIRDVKHTTLNNGVRVITIDKPTESMMLSCFVRVGGRFEEREDSGLSHFLEHMAFKGTEKYNAAELGEMIEVLGANVNAFTSQYVTAYMVEGLREHRDAGLDMLAEIMLNSTFPDDEIERERAVIYQEMHQYQTDPSEQHRDFFSEKAYPDHPRGFPIIGFSEKVEFKRDDLLRWFGEHFHAGNIILLQSGPNPHDEFVARVESLFGHLTARNQSQYRDAALTTGQHYNELQLNGQAMSVKAFSIPGLRIDKEGYRSFQRLAQVVGSGMSSPMFQSIREREGLCYGVAAHVSQHADESMFAISARSKLENVERINSLAMDEIEKIANGTIRDIDWERSRNAIKNSMRLLGERSHMTYANGLAMNAFEGFPYLTPDETSAFHLECTKEDVIKAAGSLLNQASIEVTSGG